MIAQFHEHGVRSGTLRDDRPQRELMEATSEIGAYQGMRVERARGSVINLCSPEIIVRVMGPVDVVDADRNVIDFHRSKSVELLAWITSHRASSRRSIARAAMWDAGVQDATFNNVVSEARRALTAVSTSETVWISRTYDDNLQLSERVLSDAEILASALRNHSAQPSDLTITALREALGQVRGLPFSGTSYLWPDTEGITTNIVIQILDAAVIVAEHALELNDLTEVFWATGQGLQVVQGHEGLVAIRMRAHAANRSMAGVESEWRSYLRAVAVDSWSGGQPNPELAELRKSLSYA